jgi:hypothetical protein
VAASLAVAHIANAGVITIDQFFSAAPNAFGSSSWSSYVSNAMTSLRGATPGSPVGTPGTPDYYASLGGSFSACNIMVTSFNSWGCSASPSGAFANEFGERLHAGVVISDQGGTFDLANVSFVMKSSDVIGNFTDPGTCPTGNGGSLCWESNLAGTDFSAGTRIGLDSMGNVICDSTHSCTDTTPLSELIYVGDGNAEWPGGPGDLLTGQPAIDEWTNYIDKNIEDITNQYCVQDSSGSNSCNTAEIRNADFVPEPGSVAIFVTALFGLSFVLVLQRRGNFLPRLG